MPYHALFNTPLPTQTEQQQGRDVLRQIGPRTLVELNLPDTQVRLVSASGAALPQPIIGPGLIDTGASRTCIDEGLASTLGLQLLNTVQVHTPAGTVPKNVYAVKLSFPGSMLPPIAFFAACGASLMNQGLVALIGRDFLVNKTLHYDGGLSIVTISW